MMHSVYVHLCAMSFRARSEMFLYLRVLRELGIGTSVPPYFGGLLFSKIIPTLSCGDIALTEVKKDLQECVFINETARFKDVDRPLQF